MATHPELLDDLLETMAAREQATAPTPTQPVATPAPTPAPAPTPSSGDFDAADVGQAIVGGAAQAVFEAKDFLLGEPTEKSAMRQSIEQGVKDLSAKSGWLGATAGITQFAVGMLGLGKLTAPLKLAQRVGHTVESVGRAATVGAVAFDPHAERLSNIIEQFPSLQNPVTKYLAADPSDSAAEGRLKAALESIGLDAALIGTFAAGTRVLKAVRSGDEAGVHTATEELQRAVTPDDGPGSRARQVAHWEAQVADFEREMAERTARGEAPPSDGPDLLALYLQNAKASLAEAHSLPDAPAPAAPGAPTAAAPQQQGRPTGAPTGPKAPKLAEVTDEQVTGLVAASRSDAEALASSGSWDAAVSAGHTFGQGGSIPWQKLAAASEEEVGAFIGRVAETLTPELDSLKGGAVLTDAAVQRMVGLRARLWGEEPAALMGTLQAAGKQAQTMAANMEASFLVAQRSMQDTYAAAARISGGYFEEWGSREAAHAALKDMLRVSATAFGHAQSMRAAAGRALRRNRSEFALEAADVSAMQALDGEQLAKILANTNGDPRALAKAMSPSLWAKTTDALQYLYVNNLLWGYKTHAVNLATNLYMVGVRPMERYIGSFRVGGEEGARLRAENLRQYAYMGTQLSESWRMAVDAWKAGDSVLNPHNTEALNVGGALGKQVAQAEYRPFTSLANLAYNAGITAAKTLGAPTRVMGTVDEMVKQVVYRSKVQAAAHVEGASQGLAGRELSDFVRDRLMAAFDAAGRATDLAALQEARIATFQQDLLPNTVGKGVATFTANQPWAKFVLPFVRTPTNAIRSGIKLTPGLNLLQTEYRQMIQGAMGPEAQAQAAGQMAMGAMFLGLAAHLASAGLITGGGPSDRRLRKTLMDTGWQPYSGAIPNEDGTRTYFPIGKLDPVGMPFGTVADIVDVLSHGETDADGDKVTSMATGLLLSLAKQLTSKSYLLSINQVVDAIMDPDANMERTAGGIVANLVPMASALRMMNPDPNMRDARDFVDKVKATIPGFSETVPARYDWAGEVRGSNPGIFITGDRTAVDAEVRRMVEEGKVAMGPPSPNIDGVDLRELTLKDGRNAYEAYQQLSGKPTPRTTSLKDMVARQMKLPAYAKAPDGDAGTRGTKLWMLTGTIAKYRAAALQQVKADPNVREALLKKDMRVRAAYSANRAAPTVEANRSQNQLQNVGAAFGVDLSSLSQ